MFYLPNVLSYEVKHRTKFSKSEVSKTKIKQTSTLHIDRFAAETRVFELKIHLKFENRVLY